MKEAINQALEVLKNGGVILYPTDTDWGIGCDATNEESVNKIKVLLEAGSQQSFTVLLDTENKLQSYVSEVPDIAYDLIEYAEKPLTIIYSGAKNLAKNVINADGTIGIRVIKNPFCEQLLQRFRKPIVCTTPNKSSQVAQTFEDVSQEIIDGVDYVVPLEQELTTTKEPPTIMKLDADGRFAFIRR